MPINEIEEHPYLDYFMGMANGNNRQWNEYTKMIIGSFPVYNITKTIHPVEVDRSVAENVAMPFFYGSAKNMFWRRLATALIGHDGDPWLRNTPTLRKSSAIDLLEENHILLTDVIKRTNRYEPNKPFSPSDNALLNLQAEQNVIDQFELNNNIIDCLINGENIRSIYFTAQKCVIGKTPGGWFHNILNNAAIQFAIIFEGENILRYLFTNEQGTLNREITLFFLPTPSAKRSIPLTENIQHPMFVNYLTSIDPEFYETLQAQQFVKTAIQHQTLANHREDFVQHWWIKFLVNEDFEFNGTL